MTLKEVEEEELHYCYFQILQSYLMEEAEDHFDHFLINCLDWKCELVPLESEDVVGQRAHLTSFPVLLNRLCDPDEKKCLVPMDVDY